MHSDIKFVDWDTPAARVVGWFLLSFVLLGLATPSAWADVTIERTENWINASQNIDGSPYIDASHLNFYYSAPSGWNVMATLVDPSLTQTSTMNTLTVPNDEIITVQATHVDLNGNESILSNMRSFGPFVQTDVVEPNTLDLAPGSQTIVGCELGYVCSQP